MYKQYTSKEADNPDFWSKHWANKDILEQMKSAKNSELIHLFKKYLPKKGVILEAGCGIGGNMEWIVEKFPNVKKYACELKEGNLETAINNFPQIEFRKCNIISLPYPDKSIDVVLSDMVIYYLEGEDILKAISEMKRVAKKMIIISEETGKILSYIPKEMKVIKHDWDCPSKVEGEGIRFIATLKYGNKKGNNLEQLTEFLQ